MCPNLQFFPNFCPPEPPAHLAQGTPEFLEGQGTRVTDHGGLAADQRKASLVEELFCKVQVLVSDLRFYENKMLL